MEKATVTQQTYVDLELITEIKGQTNGLFDALRPQVNDQQYANNIATNGYVIEMVFYVSMLMELNFQDSNGWWIGTSFWLIGKNFNN